MGLINIKSTKKEKASYLVLPAVFGKCQENINALLKANKVGFPGWFRLRFDLLSNDVANKKFIKSNCGKKCLQTESRENDNLRRPEM